MSAEELSPNEQDIIISNFLKLSFFNFEGLQVSFESYFTELRSNFLSFFEEELVSASDSLLLVGVTFIGDEIVFTYKSDYPLSPRPARNYCIFSLFSMA
jgi:hypothetical protein